jgi:predicted membrane protein
MRNNLQIVFGGLIALFGLSILLGLLFDVNFWGVCFSVGLILFGVWILVRPRILPEDSNLKLLIFGDVKKRGEWQVNGEEIWMFIGDVRLDMTSADIPSGETTYRVIAFIGDIDIKLPEGIGFQVSSMAFVNDTKILGRKRDYIFTPFSYRNDIFETAEKKISLEALCFVADIDYYQEIEEQANL